MNKLLYPLYSFLITLILINLMLPFLKKYTLDLPNLRSSHTVPTPRGGGLSIVLSCFLMFYLSKDMIIFLCAPLAIIGFLDDIFKVPRILRLLVQVITSLILVLKSNIYSDLILLNYSNLLPIFFCLLIFLCVAFINFTNFVDGLDGFVTSMMIPLFLTASLLVSSNYLIIVCSLCAFLIFNWSPAKLFMGDIGSTFLGCLYFIAILNANSFNSALGLFLISAPIQIDCITCILRRYIKSQNIFEAHKMHLYQRLNQNGWSPRKISLTYFLSIVLLSFFFICFGISSFILTIPITFLFGFYLEKNYSKNFY